MASYNSVLDLIGNTPLVDVSALSPNPQASISLKLEGQNPGGSVKDRVALSLVEDAEKSGRLSPGATLIEPSSGNTGIGLAMVCRVKGYHLKVVMPSNVSVERRQLLRCEPLVFRSEGGQRGIQAFRETSRAIVVAHAINHIGRHGRGPPGLQAHATDIRPLLACDYLR